MTINKLVLIFSAIISLIPIVIYWVVFDILPNQFPTSFALNGDINAYTSKENMIFLLLMPIAMLILFVIIPKIDPKKSNYKKFEGFYNYFVAGITIFFTLFLVAILLVSLYPNLIPIHIIVPAMVGVLFLVIGNYLPRIKQTYTMGIKTPWTLESEVVWNKTHRLGGFCFMIAGVLMLLTIVITSLANYIIFFILALTMFPCVMSYFYYQKEQKSKDDKDIQK